MIPEVGRGRVFSPVGTSVCLGSSGSTFGLVDSDGPCYAVMVYNMVQSWGVLIGDSVAIPEPNLRLHQIQHKGKDYCFSSVRVETPLLLVVNGKPQGSSSQAAATVASRPQCE